MEANAKTFLFDLLDTPSPTGFEIHGQRRWAAYVKSAADQVEIDTYGTTWATLKGAGGDDAPKVMLEAHADEIGFMVSHISDDGFLYVNPIGGSDKAIARGKRVRILGDAGEVVGIIGNTAIHLRKRDKDEVPDWHDLFIDIGAQSADEVRNRGLRVGHPAVYAEASFSLTDNRIAGRALDNRIGGFIIAQVMHRLGANRPMATVQAVNAVQEEIGGNGARMITYRLNPDVAVVLDVTHATDSPGISKTKYGAVKLGKGPTLTHGTANHPNVVAHLLALAEKNEIPIQHEASSRYTGTDTDDVFVSKSGVASALVSLPMRYMHSTVEMVDLQDVEHCIALLTAFAQSITSTNMFALQLRE